MAAAEGAPLHFRFQDLRSFTGKSAAIKRPREVAQFSFDDKHVCHPSSDRSLRYYYPPFFDAPNSRSRPRIDLSTGLDTFIKYDESTDLHLNALLETIQDYELRTNSVLEADILTWRGMMTKILTAPFDQFGEFEMNANLFEGTIYLEENKAKKQTTEASNTRQFGRHPLATMMYWGYKFETISTLSRPWSDCSRDEIEQRNSEIVDTHAQYCSIVRTGIGGHSIVIGGEVDAVKGLKPEGLDCDIPYIELKTSENFRPDNFKAAEKFEKKMCRFWAQSFLLGVPTVIVGFRDQDGFLERLEEWETQRIPGFVQSRGLKTWDGNICINFAAAFLDFLRQTIADDTGTWLVKRTKGASEITLTKVSNTQSPDFVTAAFREHRLTFKPATT